MLVALLPAAAAFCGPTPASRRCHTSLRPSAATCAGALRELPAVILPGDQALAPGERRTLVFADKSEKRALKQVMKGGAQGKAGKVFGARGGAGAMCGPLRQLCQRPSVPVRAGDCRQRACARATACLCARYNCLCWRAGVLACMRACVRAEWRQVGRLAVVHFDEAALAARRMELAPIGCEVEVVCCPWSPREKECMGWRGGEKERASTRARARVRAIGGIRARQCNAYRPHTD